MSNYLEIDSKILEKNLLLENNSSSDAGNLENFYLSPENYITGNEPCTLLTPTAGLCVKTTDSKNRKVFINICKLDELPEPKHITEADLLELSESDHPPAIRVALSIQLPHDEFDKSGNPTVAYDIAMNTNFVKKIESSLIFRNFVMPIVFDGIENKYNVELKREGYVILRNRKCLGELKPHLIRKNKLTGASAKPLIEELQSSNIPSKPEEVGSKCFRKTPEFRLFEDTRNDVVIAEFHLPQLVTPKDLTVDVNESRIILDHRRGSYFAEFFVPVKLDENKTSSTFNINTNILTLKMPKILAAV